MFIALGEAADIVVTGFTEHIMSEPPSSMNDMASTPASKSSRQAELEELRQKSLAQSNAQKLGKSCRVCECL